MKKPVVILVFAHKPWLDSFEKTALDCCVRILGNHPIKLVCPAGMDVSTYLKVAPQIGVDFISPCWLESLPAYNRLKIDPFLYQRYAEYEYLMTYELDAYVFRDELLEWCGRGWDYVGAPWFEGQLEATRDAAFAGVGNSGFSLRKISSCRRVLARLAVCSRIASLFAINNPERLEPRMGIVERVIRRLLGLEVLEVLELLQQRYVAEDLFWCHGVARAFDSFRIPSADEALRFSFEANPDVLLAMNDGRLPFGCHAWMKVRPEFWSNYINVIR